MNYETIALIVLALAVAAIAWQISVIGGNIKNARVVGAEINRRLTALEQKSAATPQAGAQSLHLVHGHETVGGKTVHWRKHPDGVHEVSRDGKQTWERA